MITKLERNSNFLLPPEANKHDERYDKTTTKQSQLFHREFNFLISLQKATTQKKQNKIIPYYYYYYYYYYYTTTTIIILLSFMALSPL